MTFGLNQKIYLDANASVLPNQIAKDALLKSLNTIGNPSSPHAIGRLARQSLDKSREQVAKALGANSKEAYFNSGASEANRWLVDAIILAGKQRNRPFTVSMSDLEHPSMAKPINIAAQNGEVIFVGFDEDPEIIICTAAHNETGVIPDWDKLISQASDETILIADCAQSLARLENLPKRIDALVCSAHKIGAYAGSGAMVIRGYAKKLSPPWSGGGQESGLRPGTESLHLIAAFGAVCEDIKNIRNQNQKLSKLRDELEQEILKIYPDAEIIGLDKPRLPNTSAIVFNNTDGEALRIKLDMAGLCVGFGSACSALAPEPSPSLIAMGYSPEQAKATVRFSLGVEFSESELKEVTRRLKEVLN